MYEEKRIKIYLIEAKNEANSGATGKFSNEKRRDFKLFNLCKRFFKGFFNFYAYKG